jgi:Reverse transcriptase (RNA-dependent DNA polymerase).
LTTFEYGECLAASSGDAVKYYEVILDSGSQVNIIHPRFLRDVREGHGGCKGLFGSKTKLTKVGMLEGFFECLGSDDTRVSVLSQADVEDAYDVTYEPGTSYTVHMGVRDLEFVRRNKLYVADFSDWVNPDYQECNALLNLLTVEEREHMYTRKEVERAHEAKEFIKNAGYPSRNEAIHLIRDGNLNNVPIAVEDVNRYYDIYGPMVEMVRGKTTKRKVKFIRDEPDMGIKEQRKMQRLTSDVMFVKQVPFLVSIASPLELTISSTLTSQKLGSLGQALQVQINLLRSRGFDSDLVIVDPLKSLKNLDGSFPGVAIDATGAGDHLPKVDAKIRRIKENVRSILAGLPYSLPKNRIKDLVTYVVNRMNTRRTTALSDNVCPRAKFTGKKIDYTREFSLGFGDYVEAYDPKVRSNSMQERTEPCIALYPAANMSGSWVMWNMKSDTYVRRTHWTKMRVTREVIDTMNTLAGASRVIQADAIPQSILEEAPAPREEAVGTVVPVQEPVIPTMTTEEATIEVADAEEEEQNTRDVPDGGVYDEDVPPGSVLDETVPSLATEPIVRRSERIRTVKRDEDFKYSLTQLSVKQGLRRHGKFAKRAIRKEFDQLFKKKAVLKPVKRSDLSGKQRRKIIRSSMFLKEKFDGMGKFEKLKGRLVADGRMQDRSLYADKQSPTAKLESIIMELAIAAREGKKLAKVDIAGAYLNASIGRGDDIHMELGREVTTILVESMPKLKRFVQPNGKLLTKILKAMYGLIQSAALWYDALTTYLKGLGFVQNSIDNCILNKKNGGHNVTIILYVDDILILSNQESDIHWLIGALKSKYGELSIESGTRLNYLGMVLDVMKNGEIKMRMDGYVDSVLSSFPEYDSIRKSTTPASINLFKPGSGRLLCETDKKRFHTTTAKLLYLSKRTRPDIQLPVLYLCTRVKEPTVDDDTKLLKILGYLKLTRSKVRIISPRGNPSRLVAYVDASFASHSDGKGHTGLVIKWGATTLGTISRKQKIATKSSTEAELVGLTDVLDEVERANEYMEEQGVNLDVPIVYQDNMSTITLVTNENSGNVRTRHLNARRAIAYESSTVLKSVSIRYIKTADMLADVFTKPLGGRLFYKFAEKLLGRDRTTEEDERRGMRSDEDQRSMQVRRGCVGNSSTTRSNRMRKQPCKFSHQP